MGRRQPLALQLPDLDFVADGGVLVEQIEAYLASLPAPARTVAMPAISVHGSVDAPWDWGMTRPQPTRTDRLRGRRPAPVPIDTAAHLRLLTRYLTVHGWCQGALWDSRGQVCLLGGQLAVLRAGYGTEATVVRARTLLLEQFVGQGEYRTVDDWNDAPGRTRHQVFRLLDRAGQRAARLG
jgi:hypothetical protein